MGLYRWDLECLLDTLSLEMTDRLCIRGCGEEIWPRCSHCMVGCERNTTWLMGPSGPQIEGDGITWVESLQSLWDRNG